MDATATLETLIERQFVKSIGRKDTPGRPLLYGTTEEFLRHFGLKGLEALPPVPQGELGALPGMDGANLFAAQDVRPIVPPRPLEETPVPPVEVPAHETQPTS